MTGKKVPTRPGGSSHADRAALGLMALGLAAALAVGTRFMGTAALRANTPNGAPAGPTPSAAAFLPVVAQGYAGPAAYLPVVLQVPSPTPTATPPPVTPPAEGDWRVYTGYYRAAARLPALAENGGWSDGAFKHAQYMVENQTASASELAGNLWFTQEGAAAGPNSLLQLQGLALNDQQAVDQWMQWPFHAIDILDPALGATGFGRYSRDAGTFDFAAALDVRRGLGAVPGGVSFPIKWPDHNTTVYLTSYDGFEQPDPLTSCPGFPLGGPSGLPIILQVGPGDLTPVVTAHSLHQGSTPLLHCVFTESTYTNSIAAMQALGRAQLAARDAIVLIPKDPLTAGLSYTVSITVNGQVVTWTFAVAGSQRNGSKEGSSGEWVGSWGKAGPNGVTHCSAERTEIDGEQRMAGEETWR